MQLVKLKSGYLEGTIGMLHGEAQAELRTEFNTIIITEKMYEYLLKLEQTNIVFNFPREQL